VDSRGSPPPDAFTRLPLNDVRLSGRLGQAIDLCVKNRVMAQDGEHLVEPFRRRGETTCWSSEFWGKWFTSAVAAQRYTGDPKLLETPRRATRSPSVGRQSASAIMNSQPAVRLGDHAASGTRRLGRSARRVAIEVSVERRRRDDADGERRGKVAADRVGWRRSWLAASAGDAHGGAGDV
jgi:hypothetical protein